MNRNHIWSTNLRFNLDKEMQRKAWEYLQTMDRQVFKSYSQVIAVAVVDFLSVTTANRMILIWKQGNGKNALSRRS